MEILINNKITLSGVPQGLLTDLRDRLSFTNPKWIENDRRGYSNWQTARILKFYDELARDADSFFAIKALCFLISDLEATPWHTQNYIQGGISQRNIDRKDPLGWT